jgi:hypothetical protein
MKVFNWSPFSKTYSVKCPDGSRRIVHKDIDNAFPLAIPGWQSNVRAKVQADAKLGAELDANYATKIDGLLVALDERNNSLMLDFRAAYVVFQADPCNNNGHLLRSIDRITERRNQIAAKTLQIGALVTLAKEQPANRRAFIEIFSDIVRGLVPEGVAELEVARVREMAVEEAVEKIHEANEIAKELKENR